MADLGLLNSDFSFFDGIPDEILVKILVRVPRRYWHNVSLVCTRFQRLNREREIFRSSNLSCVYGMSEMLVKNYLNTGIKYIVSLNLNHCNWLSTTMLAASIPRCKQIQHLYLLDTRLTLKDLCRVIRSLDCLKTLVVSVSDLLEFSNEINDNEEMQNSLRHLQHFGLHMCEETKGSTHNSAPFDRTTVIEYCPNLESFSVTGQPAAVKKLPSLGVSRLINPLLVRIENISKLTTMEIHNTNNAAAQLYFFKVLFKAFEAGVKLKNLSVSGFHQCDYKPNFFRALKESRSTLENIDMSSSQSDELPGLLTIVDLPCMKYLNLSDNQTKNTSRSLLKIASQCSNLVSLNLQGATSGLINQRWTSVEFGELDHVLQICRHLAHLNLSGIHMHCEDLEHTLLDILIKHRLKDLRFLALPLCCLVKTMVPSKTNVISHNIRKRHRDARQTVASTGAGDSCRQVEVFDISLLAQAYPLLESLEIINCNLVCSAVFNNQVTIPPFNDQMTYTSCVQSTKLMDDHFKQLNLLKYLRYLQLTGLPGCSMLGILQNISHCVQIERLYLTHIRTLGGPVPTQAQDYLTKLCSLKDLRIEQPGLKLDKQLFDCLLCCPLERLVIVSERSCLTDLNAVEEYVQKASSLFLIQIFTSDTTFSNCVKLRRTLMERFMVERPGFIATVETLHQDRIYKAVNKLPLHHLEEMTILSSKVATKLSHKLGQPFLS